MPYILFILLLLLIVFGPNIWVSYILNKHQKPLPGMPGTGGELAKHLLQQKLQEHLDLPEAWKQLELMQNLLS